MAGTFVWEPPFPQYIEQYQALRRGESRGRGSKEGN